MVFSIASWVIKPSLSTERKVTFAPSFFKRIAGSVIDGCSIAEIASLLCGDNAVNANTLDSVPLLVKITCEGGASINAATCSRAVSIALRVILP